MTNYFMTRRSFLTLSAALPWTLAARGSMQIPLGLESYSVRNALKADPKGTVRAVAEMGYQAIEFHGPYFEWSETQTKEMRRLLDDLGMRCFSTHNEYEYLGLENIGRARDKNLILGSAYAVMASSKPKPTVEGWKSVADALNYAAEQLEPSGLKTGYHNHQPEFTPVDGQRPMEILAKFTKPSVMLQLDIGTCLAAGSDPAAWIRANPGRIRSIHCKDWSPEADKRYKVLFGEGVADWRGIFEAAEGAGGIECYLMEQEGSRFSELDTARRCFQTFRNKHLA